MIPLIALRIRYEERYLTEHFPGYSGYCDGVHFRVAPPIW
jgi:protein-S-isoprenylcysteine O-methyltransferase Ste14